MRKIHIRAVFANKQQCESFFIQLDELYSMGTLSEYQASHSYNKESQQTSYEISLATDIDIGAIRLILGQAWTIALDVFCPNEDPSLVKKRKRRKRRRRYAHQKAYRQSKPPKANHAS